MDDQVARGVPAWFWVVALFAVAWEVFGCTIYLTQSLTEEGARDGGYATMASWQWGVFAVAVWSGLLGAILLVLRNRWAQILLVLSLVAAAGQYGYAAMQGSLPASDRPMAAIILAVAVLLAAFAGIARRRGWLR